MKKADMAMLRESKVDAAHEELLGVLEVALKLPSRASGLDASVLPPIQGLAGTSGVIQ